VLKPRLVAAGVKPVATAVVGTVKGDLHDIGKNLVCMMLEGAGLKVVDAGIDVAPEKFVQLAKTTSRGDRRVRPADHDHDQHETGGCRRQGLRVECQGMVGGAPVTQAFCDEIGAQGYAADAASAATWQEARWKVKVGRSLRRPPLFRTARRAVPTLMTKHPVMAVIRSLRGFY